ncbi:unnamed protein product [Tetraodon nigroviridis]|nr:unnamed protein product [Tetraodon nigroviridis]
MLLAIFSAATGLKCRLCGGDYSCWTVGCLPNADRCATTLRDGARGCIPSSECGEFVKCCEGDLCNGAVPPGSSILLLLLSASIMTVFL